MMRGHPQAQGLPRRIARKAESLMNLALFDHAG
jgi:hypothetical protein